MRKIVFIGAGSGFGAKSFVDIMSFPELQDSEIVLVDINESHLEPVLAYCRKVVEHYGAPTELRAAKDWRDGVLDGADYVITSFAQGGPAYQGVPFHYEMSIPRQYNIHQNVGDTVGVAATLRTMRTAPELLAIGKDMEQRCPGAYLLNYVNPMSMLTRILSLACPKIHAIGLCHNIQYTIRDIASWIGVSHKELVYEAAGINHIAWFLRLGYLDGRDAYPDLRRAGADPAIRSRRSVQFELLDHLGYFTTESSRHCAEYLPHFMHSASARESVGLEIRETTPDVPHTATRWSADSPLVQETEGRRPLSLTRSFEYGVHIIHAVETDAVYRMNLNVMNDGLIENLTRDDCVEVTCTADRGGIHPHRVGTIPIELAARCQAVASSQTLAADAVLEKDLEKACRACIIDPLAAASATPAQIRECFGRLLDADKQWLLPFWGKELAAWPDS